ncbi:hypothetical protein BMF94_0830 [Rhodotorula taiwanensis]|uniref:FHA domain-containing protein n=1 Tax=Rhodotorula taiwanensis TaxID=741276 RepID=A0A2S5BH65_9BASI|nr:hypothetical protein BMF94_0830 [Rhodotorula taiwanensis]
MLDNISNRLNARQGAVTLGAPNKPQQTAVAVHSPRSVPQAPARWASTYMQADSTASSSSSPGRPATSSSPFFARTRLDAFDVPTSPGQASVADKLATSPILPSIASLPPSSPSFALSAAATALDELANASARVSPLAEAAAESYKRDPGLDTPRVLHLEHGTVLYFGRKARKALPHTRQGRGDETHVPVRLPKSAVNASRVHCSVRISGRGTTENSFLVEVRITGQNGMKVDGKVRPDGSVVRVEKSAGAKMRLSFWGWSAKVIVAESEMGLDSGSDGEDVTPATLVEDQERHAEQTSSPRPYKSRRRAASPALSFRSDDHGLSPEPELSSDQMIASSRASSMAPIGPTAAAVRAAALASSLGLDLPGLIASAIVFHSRSTVAATEVVHGLLGETRSMWTILTTDEEELEQLKESAKGEARAIEAWRDLVEYVLAREDMFGMIDNSGLKDASGRPLPPYYFYIPDQDPSADRVAALEPFVKRVRGARTKKQARYFWAKPSLKRNR